MKYHVQKALDKLKKLQDETTNVSIGAAIESAGWFFRKDFQGVIDDLETAIAVIETENDHVG